MYLKSMFLADCEKWYRKNYFESPPCAKTFLENHFYIMERRTFAQNCKFNNKNDLLCEWRDFNICFVVYVQKIDETLSHKFHPHST